MVRQEYLAERYGTIRVICSKIWCDKLKVICGKNGTTRVIIEKVWYNKGDLW